jgi:hypothetical protein
LRVARQENPSYRHIIQHTLQENREVWLNPREGMKHTRQSRAIGAPVM